MVAACVFACMLQKNARSFDEQKAALGIPGAALVFQ